MAKVILLDRDGVINQDSLYYIKNVDEFSPLPGSLEAIAKLCNAGYKIGVATNQSGVSRGLYSEKTLEAIHSKLFKLVKEAGGSIDALEYCKHMPEQGCWCRKPNPGMLLNLARYFKCQLEDVPYIGDRISDIQTAQAAGARPMLILSPMTERKLLENYPQVPVFTSLAEFVDDWLTQND